MTELKVGDRVKVEQPEGETILTVQIVGEPVELDYEGTKVTKRLCAGTNQFGFPEPFFDTDVTGIAPPAEPPRPRPSYQRY